MVLKSLVRFGVVLPVELLLVRIQRRMARADTDLARERGDSALCDGVSVLAVGMCSAWLRFANRQRVYRLFTRRSRKSRLRAQLDEADTYEEWLQHAFDLDVLLGNDLWRANPRSKRYDHRLIMARSAELYELRNARDYAKLAYLLRSGLIRNFGNISDIRLYNHSYVGTKLLVETYVKQICQALEEYLLHADNSITPQQKLDFFHDTRQMYGSTALVLHGGAAFGLTHLGVIRALYLRNLLPKVIVGTKVGAVVATVVCVRNDEELSCFLENPFPAFIGSDATSSCPSTSWYGKSYWYLKEGIYRLGSSGHLVDLSKLYNVVQRDVGDLTFEEAFNRTQRILNITVAMDNSTAPALLNYLTAPTVVS